MSLLSFGSELFRHERILPLLVLSCAVYFVALGVYRVYLSPLANIPGPRLAALTTWYQGYYDLYLGGQFFKKLDQLHQQYGPIIRVNPHEVHVADGEFIDVLFTTNSQRRDKYKWLGRSILGKTLSISNSLGRPLIEEPVPDSIGGTVEHDLHRKRRAALSPYFSTTSIRGLEHTIQKSMVGILRRLKTAGQTAGVMNINTLFRAAACDIINQYSFGTSTGYLDCEDYNIDYFKAIDAQFAMSAPLTFISWLGPLMRLVPPSVMAIVYPGLKNLWYMHEQWARQIEEIRSCKSLEEPITTIFHGILSSNLPPAEKSSERLRQEAQFIIIAGQDTLAYTLSSIVFELLANPDVLAKLRDELVSALPEPDAVPALAVVEKLPYLHAVVQECLRIHPAALVRMARVAPDNALVYHDKASGKAWTIPANTPISMSALPVHMNEAVFPNPTKFEPGRWLDNPRLDRYLFGFSKGSRACLGFYLAYSELYIIVAGIFRKYDVYDGTGKQKGSTLALYDTRRERDVDAVRHLVIAYPAKGSQGVRVLVRE